MTHETLIQRAIEAEYQFRSGVVHNPFYARIYLPPTEIPWDMLSSACDNPQCGVKVTLPDNLEVYICLRDSVGCAECRVGLRFCTHDPGRTWKTPDEAKEAEGRQLKGSKIVPGMRLVCTRSKDNDCLHPLDAIVPGERGQFRCLLCFSIGQMEHV